MAKMKWKTKEEAVPVDKTLPLEARVASLEKELEELRKKLAELLSK